MERRTAACMTLPIRVLLVFSYPLLVCGVKSVLKEHSDFDVVGTATNMTETLDALEMLDADIVFGDASACAGNIASLSTLHSRHPRVKIVITGDVPEAKDFDDFAKIAGAGISAVLPDTIDTSQLLEYLRIIARNDMVVYASLHENTSGLPHAMVKAKHESLTKREIEILRLVAEGCANKEIAIRCSVSESTVKAHLRQLLEKLQASNRAQAVAIAHERDILD